MPLQGDGIIATKTDGTVVTNMTLRPGRVVIIGPEPLVEASRSGGNLALNLYGRPGASFQVEWTTNLSNPAAWQNGPRVPMTNLFRTFEGISLSAPITFYRAYEFVASPGLLEAGPGPNQKFNLMVFGQSGIVYSLETAPNILPGTQWTEIQSISLSNSFQRVEGISTTNGTRFLRLRSTQ